MLSIVLEVCVTIRGQLTYFLLRRYEVFKYCFANKGQVDVWIIGRNPLPEAKRKRDHFRRIYEFLYRKKSVGARQVVLYQRASQFTSVAKVPNTGEGDSSQPYDVMYTFFCVYLLMFCDVTYIFTYTFLCLFTYVL